MGPDEKYLGPVFDESAIRFFLIFNQRLKLFHYILDETIPVADQFVRARLTSRIVIGKRTGFAYYQDYRLKRKILIGVFQGNARVNNYFDGPFDQLPDNFIEGEALREAILAVEPSLKGKIDRVGGAPDGSGRYLIGPYVYYRGEDEFQPFHDCATSKRRADESYYRCFVHQDDGVDGESAPVKPRPARKNSRHRPLGAGAPFLRTLRGCRHAAIEGTIVGVIVFALMQRYLAAFGTWYLILLGTLAIVVMLLAPRGIRGFLSRIRLLHWPHRDPGGRMIAAHSASENAIATATPSRRLNRSRSANTTGSSCSSMRLLNSQMRISQSVSSAGIA